MRPVGVGVILFSLLPVIILAQEPQVTHESRLLPNLQITSRAVLVDVIVTDHSGKPVVGLPREAFTVSEQGKPQAISFFEEHGTATPSQPVHMPEMPPDTFANFSPFPEPAAVNVILLDTLNTRMESQSEVHRQILDFLKSAKPGSRSAIFGMGLTLRFIQGFNDDPAVLATALSNKKNIEVENAVMLKSQAETNAQDRVVTMGAAGLAHLFAETDSFTEDQRKLITLGNLQRLAVFLQGFPGRKNIIWFTERPPGVFNPGGSTGDPAIEDEIKKTIAMMGEARAALYPVDARGTAVSAQYTAENNPAAISTNSEALRSESLERNTDQINAQFLAEDSGGRAFANTNGLSDVLDRVTSESENFYTLSYAPANAKMDGRFRKIDVQVAGGRYKLLHRRGYFAVDAESPSTKLAKKVQKLTGQEIGAADPLLPSMQLGMPQSQQILYKVRVVAGEAGTSADDKDKNRFKLEFAIDLNDLRLALDSGGLHKGKLNVWLIVFDRYGNVVRQQDHVIGLNIKPEVYTIFQNTGVQLHFELALPKGNYWLRSGILDVGSHKVGTLEIPLATVKPVETIANHPQTGNSPHKNRPSPRRPTNSSKLINVQQLEELINQYADRSDKEAAQSLSGNRVSERLTTARLDQLQRTLPGERSRLTLLAIADVSAFFAPPPIDVDSRLPPDQNAEKQMLSHAIDFVLATTAQMPNFLAKKKITRFQNARLGLGTSFPVITPDRYHLIDNTVEAVRFRDGQEEFGETSLKSSQQPRPGLVTRGVFGPMLQTVIHDILNGNIGWLRWEASSSGPVAVFRYAVPKDKATFVVTWCCSFQTPGSDTQREVQLTSAYHGELSVDPESGTITRFTVVADLNSGGPISTAEVVVEYGPVEIGGRIYQCPLKSATLLVAKSFIVHQDWLEQFDITSVSDTSFDEYHVFRSEMKVLER